MGKRTKSFGFMIWFALELTVMSAVIVVFSGDITLWGGKPWPGMIAGGAAMLLAVPFHIFGRKRNMAYPVSCILNAAGSGLFAASYFTYMKETPSAADIWIPLTIVLLLMFARCVAASFTDSGKIIDQVILGLNFAAAAAVIVLWIICGGIFYPILYFMLISEFMHGLFLLIYIRDGKEPLRMISFASYSYALIIGFVVLVVLTEGEVLDGFDFGMPDKKSKRR